ncbi:DUF2953 domain-containing protein [uncultured Clostridium sp.]|uniref:DUF2953 domain-containing protein n=1 Tax=Clostridium sp. TaxID=1506 RepID=UPI0025F43C43|nr:DUF2953 domain-containing protein [uncultured Clostridium sp.]
MLFFIIIVALIFILFIPIPLKFNLHYSKDRYYIKFYNINIISNDDGILKKFLNKKDNIIKESKINYSKTKDDIEIDYKGKNLNLKPFLKTLYINLKRNKFKPSIRFSSNSSYSLGDASRTAICLGLFYNINPILLYIFSILFKVKLLKTDFNPIFKDELLFELTIRSIITFNLAQIIYILFIIYKSIRKNRR